MSFFLKALSGVSNHISPAFFMNYLSEAEGITRKSHNIALAWFHLTSQCLEAAAHLDVFESQFRSNPIRSFSSAISISPFLLKIFEIYIRTRKLSEEKLSLYEHKIALVYEGLNQVSRVTFIASKVAFFYATRDRYALAAAGVATLGIFFRYGLVSRSLNIIYKNISEWTDIITGVFSKNLTTQALFTTVMGLRIRQLIFPSFPPVFNENQIKHHLSSNDFERFSSSDLTQLKVNTEHLKIDPFPEVEKSNFTTLLDLFDELYRDEGYRKHLSDAAEKHPGWKEWSLKNKEKSGYEYGRYLFRALVTGIRNNSLSDSGLFDYSLLKRYLGYVEQALSKTDSSYQAGCFQKIIENYKPEESGPKLCYFLAVFCYELIYLPEAKEKIPLEQKVLLSLQIERLYLTQCFHREIWKSQPFLKYLLGEETDLHAFNFSANILGSSAGILNYGLSHERFNLSQTLLGTIIGWIARRLVYGQKIVPGYVPMVILNNVLVNKQEQYSLIDESDIENWFIQWLKATHPSKEKIFLQSQLDSFRQKSDQDKLTLLLIDMGIFEPR